jgi:hypothetical protein
MDTKDTPFGKIKQTFSKTDKKIEKIIVEDEGKEDFDYHLTKFIELKAQIEQLKTELELSENIVKTTGIRKFNERYEQIGKYPGTFNLCSDTGESILFVPTDRYLKCDQAKGQELKETYCDDVVTEKVNYIMNPELVEKYAKTISTFIETSPEISDEDRNSVIQASVSYSISKGAIENATKWSNGDITSYIEDIQPVFTLKNSIVKKA